MFNWTTTTIINSLFDYENPDKPLITVTGTGNNTKMKIKRDFLFCKSGVKKVYRAVAKDPVNFVFTINCTNFYNDLNLTSGQEATGSLMFYIGLEGSEESLYANDFYRKGKPFSVGYSVKYNATAATAGENIAKQIEKAIKDYGVAIYGKRLFKVDRSNAVLTITGMHEFQRMRKACFTKFVDLIGDEMVVSTASEEDDNVATANRVFTFTTRGSNGFGTYDHIVKDLRLPTPDNTKFYRINMDETPVVGAKYNQYIITYEAESLAKPAFTMIGQTGTSTTTHIFWVNQAVENGFLNALNALGVTVSKVTIGSNDIVTEGTWTITPDSTDANGADDINYTDDDNATVA